MSVGYSQHPRYSDMPRKCAMHMHMSSTTHGAAILSKKQGSRTTIMHARARALASCAILLDTPGPVTLRFAKLSACRSMKVRVRRCRVVGRIGGFWARSEPKSSEASLPLLESDSSWSGAVGFRLKMSSRKLCEIMRA